MNKTVFIHIGIPKTGTSSIQEFLLANRDILEKEFDLSFPIIESHAPRAVANGAAVLAQQKWELLANSIRQCPASRVFLSEELIFVGGKVQEILAAPLDKFDIKIVVYLRNAPDYLASIWGEFNKFENRVFPEPLSEFLKRQFYLSDLHSLRRFISDNSKIEFFVRPYEANSLKNGDVVTDCMGLLGIDITTGFKHPSQANQSASRKRADVMQEIYRHGVLQRTKISDEQVREKIEALLPRLSGDDRKIVETISDESIEALVSKHKDIIDDILVSSGSAPIDHFPRCYGTRRARHRSLSWWTRRKIAWQTNFLLA